MKKYTISAAVAVALLMTGSAFANPTVTVGVTDSGINFGASNSISTAAVGSGTSNVYSTASSSASAGATSGAHLTDVTTGNYCNPTVTGLTGSISGSTSTSVSGYDTVNVTGNGIGSASSQSLATANTDATYGADKSNIGLNQSGSANSTSDGSSSNVQVGTGYQGSAYAAGSQNAFAGNGSVTNFNGNQTGSIADSKWSTSGVATVGNASAISYSNVHVGGTGYAGATGYAGPGAD